MSGARPTSVGGEVQQAIRAEGQAALSCSLRVLPATASFASDCVWPSKQGHFVESLLAGMGSQPMPAFSFQAPMPPRLVKKTS